MCILRRSLLALFACSMLLLQSTCIVSTNALLRIRRMSAEDVRIELVNAVNAERRRYDKSPVCTSSKLIRASQVMANDMSATDFFAGTGVDVSSPAERVSAQGFVFTTLTEDIAAGYESATEAVAALMKVPEHRDNILGDFQFMGAGYAYRRRGYRHFWALNFANSLSEECDEEVEVVKEQSLLQRLLHL